MSEDETRIIAIGQTLTEADSAAKLTGNEGWFLIKTPEAWLHRAWF